MYFPYLRAKQFDLAALAEVNDKVYHSQTVIPIIEPVTEIKKLQYKRIADKNIPFILVINPIVGDLKSITPHSKIVNNLVQECLKSYKNYWLAFTIQPQTSLKDVQSFIKDYPDHYHVFIHFHQFKDVQSLAKVIAGDSKNQYNIFVDGLVGIDYINQFSNNDAYDVLIKDGFKKRKRNEDYPEEDFFYDLHKLYETDYGYDGFGDFTIIGSLYDPGGGPAYVVALHLTDVDEDNNVVIRHFKSESLTPASSADPGGKFGQALKKLIKHLNDSPHLNSSGTVEYTELHKSGHFPGLGTAKKISIKHHIEFVHGLIQE
ncbi:MAG: sce7725 family protein [Agriterribacter sp.]